MAGHRNKDDDFVPGWEIARGNIFFNPGFSLPSCPCAPASSCWLQRLTNIPLGMLQFGEELQRITQGTIGNPKLQYTR
jgi:hypothetical protein